VTAKGRLSGMRVPSVKRARPPFSKQQAARRCQKGIKQQVHQVKWCDSKRAGEGNYSFFWEGGGGTEGRIGGRSKLTKRTESRDNYEREQWEDRRQWGANSLSTPISRKLEFHWNCIVNRCPRSPGYILLSGHTKVRAGLPSRRPVTFEHRELKSFQTERRSQMT